MNNVELLKRLIDEAVKQMDMPSSEELARYLDAKGVPAPPCKKGDKLYKAFVITKEIVEYTCSSVEVRFEDERGYSASVYGVDAYGEKACFNHLEFEDSLFLTLEEALRCLCVDRDRMLDEYKEWLISENDAYGLKELEEELEEVGDRGIVIKTMSHPEGVEYEYIRG